MDVLLFLFRKQVDEIFKDYFQSSNPIDLSSSDLEFNDFVFDLETVLSPYDFGKGFVEDSVRVLDDSLPESRHENPVSSQGSENSGAAGSDADMNCPLPDFRYSIVDQKVKWVSTSNFVLKRKKESADGNSESRTI
ncbi:hypothetical protein L6452_18249 [Arctium lappa]|uniref:Uncharacterized protein n=1 Tax=Arctium lappa TaxID=4217 RepID=A0ACB9C5Z3_ARCLA|nr:hypothetical protein L6452_18249 [Arctium lappa]